MKLTQIPKVWKFIAGLALYALAIVVMTLFQDYRVSLFGFMILCSITFAMALWKWIPNKLVSMVLIFCLACAPCRSDAQSKDDQKDSVGPVIAGCAIIIVGCIVIWGVWRMCKKMPPPPPKPGSRPPTTNEPPQDTFIYGQFQTNGPGLIMPGEYPLSPMDDWDYAVMGFQSSTNGQDWNEEYVVTNWFNNEQYVSIMYQNGSPLKTNWAMMNWTNEIPIVIDFSRVMPRREDAPFKLWRAVQIQ